MLAKIKKVLLWCFCLGLFGTIGTARAEGADYRGLLDVSVLSESTVSMVNMEGLPQASEMRFTVISIPAPSATEPGDKSPARKTRQPFGDQRKPARAKSMAAFAAPLNMGGYLRSVPELARAQGLINSEVFEYIEQDSQNSLRSEYNIRVQDRDRMLPEADWVDGEHDYIAPWQEQLNSRLASLDEEKANYIREVSAHNAKCMPAPDEETYKWCVEEHKRLDIWRDDLHKRGDAYNADHQLYVSRARVFNSRAAALNGKVNGWFSQLGDLIERIKKAISNALGSCTEKQLRELQDKVDQFCKVKRKCDDQSLACADLNARLALNLACAAARDDMNNQCFNGGDPSHQEEANNARKTAEKCKFRISQECAPVGALGAPSHDD